MKRARKAKAIAPAAKRRRLSPHAREAEITVGAIRYFAEHGFDGGTTELARRLGITQPLLFKYFSSKDALIDRVYGEVFPGHWRPEWDDLLSNLELDLEGKVTAFYIGYFEEVLTYEYVRLFLFGALRRLKQNERFNMELERRVYLRIAVALKTASGSNQDEEWFLEQARALHAVIYQIALRRWVYLPPLDADFPALIRTKVRSFLRGALAREEFVRLTAATPKISRTRSASSLLNSE